MDGGDSDAGGREENLLNHQIVIFKSKPRASSSCNHHKNWIYFDFFFFLHLSFVTQFYVLERPINSFLSATKLNSKQWEIWSQNEQKL